MWEDPNDQSMQPQSSHSNAGGQGRGSWGRGRPHHNRGGGGNYRGRGNFYANMSSPYDPPQPHQSFQNYGQQQQHRGGFQHRGRGRGHHNEWQGQGWRGNGQAQGYGRGNRQNWRGNYQQQRGYQGQNRGGGQAHGKQDDSMYTAKDYVIPAMTCNPWAELERQREGSK